MESAVTGSLESTGWTYLGYLRSSEVDDLPKLFGMEDRLHSLLKKMKDKSKDQWAGWFRDPNYHWGFVLWLQCEVCGSLRSSDPWWTLQTGTATHRWAGQTYLWSQKRFPWKERKISIYLKILEGTENMRCWATLVCRESTFFHNICDDSFHATHRLVIMRMSDSLTFAWAKYLYLA